MLTMIRARAINNNEASAKSPSKRTSQLFPFQSEAELVILEKFYIADILLDTLMVDQNWAGYHNFNQATGSNSNNPYRQQHYPQQVNMDRNFLWQVFQK